MPSPSNKIDTGIILAAGFGTRARVIDPNVPKPLLRFSKGLTLIDLTIRRFQSIGIKRIIINLHYQAELIRQYLQGKYPNTEILFSYEKEILETGGGILQAMQLYGYTDMLVMNVDAFFTNIEPLKRIISSWQQERMETLLLLKPKEKATGDFDISATGHLIRRQEDNPYTYTGICVVSPSLFKEDKLKKFRLTDLWFQANGQKPLYAIADRENFFEDVGTLEGFKRAKEIYESRNTKKAN